MDGSELKEIREKISCPQLGDNHYGEWGILTLHQRLTIKRMLDYIDAQEKRIRSLQAENERLKEEICIQHKIIDERRAEVLRHDRCIRTLHEKLETAKAEAYKEFAERLDNETFGVYYASSLYHVVDIDDVKEILKELVGDI